MNTLFVMFFLTMLTSFSTLVLDPRDQTIFSTHAVDRKTLNYARLTVVGIYFIVTIFAMGLPPTAVLAGRLGLLFGLTTFISILLLGLTTLTLSLFLYLVVLRFFDGERLKNILNILQIVIIVGIYVAGQLPNLLPNTSFNFLTTSLNGAFHWYYVAFMPFWFMGPAVLPINGFTVLTTSLSLLAIVTPIVLLAIYLHFAENFETYLAKLDENNTTTRQEGHYFKFIRKLVTRNQEQAYFTLGWQLLSSERDFKLRVYPQLAYSFLIPVIFAFGILRDLPWTMTQGYLAYAPYFLLTTAPIAVINLQYSHQPLAMNVFSYVPMTKPNTLPLGVLKAFYWRTLAPLTVLFGLVLTVVTKGAALIPTIGALAFIYAGTLILGMFIFDRRTLPFAQAFTADNARAGTANLGTNLVGVLAVFLIVFIGGFIHNIFFDLGLALVWVILAAIFTRRYQRP